MNIGWAIGWLTFGPTLNERHLPTLSGAASPLLTATVRDRVRRYWACRLASVLHLRDEEYLPKISELVFQSIADRMLGREASMFMSGRLDSTLVAGFARQRRNSLALPREALACFRADQRRRKIWARAAAGLNIAFSPCRWMTICPYSGWETGELRRLGTW